MVGWIFINIALSKKIAANVNAPENRIEQSGKGANLLSLHQDTPSTNKPKITETTAAT